MSRNKKSKQKSGWVWWVVGESHAWHGGKACFGPYSSRKEALSKSAWRDKIVRKSISQGQPENCEE